MGDRGNIKVNDGTSSVYLYTHSKGSELPEIVQTAMRSDAARARWDDAQYLARILFCQLVGKDDWESERGFGIGAVMGDGEDQVVEVDVKLQRVLIELPDVHYEGTFNAFVHPTTKFERKGT